MPARLNLTLTVIWKLLQAIQLLMKVSLRRLVSQWRAKSDKSNSNRSTSIVAPRFNWMTFLKTWWVWGKRISALAKMNMQTFHSSFSWATLDEGKFWIPLRIRVWLMSRKIKYSSRMRAIWRGFLTIWLLLSRLSLFWVKRIKGIRKALCLQVCVLPWPTHQHSFLGSPQVLVLSTVVWPQNVQVPHPSVQ